MMQLTTFLFGQKEEWHLLPTFCVFNRDSEISHLEQETWWEDLDWHLEMKKNYKDETLPHVVETEPDQPT